MANDYLMEVMEQKENVERDLKKRAAPARQMNRMQMNIDMPAQAMAPSPMPASDALPSRPAALPGSIASVDDEAPAVDVRITGWWRWKTLVVPPNAYVVHTRRGHQKPLHIGLGLSVSFDPARDSFLVVPATMQTIIVNASCICAELQGVLVQAYVQWIIEDFATAYRKLDFSDPYDPMRIVNVQLREQAEATIKDTVATMSIDAVLSDKQPIIKELMRRLREVVEGDSEGGGLGLRIVNIQIKEAVVSSSRLWESLQSPFRAERRKVARLAELEQEELIRKREAEAERESAMLEIGTRADVEKREAEAAAVNFDREQHEQTRRAATQHESAATSFDREQKERARRAQLEAELMKQAAEHEKARLEAAAALERQRLQQKLADDELRRDADHKAELRKIELESSRRQVENDVTDGRLRLDLISRLPEIVKQMPKPTEQRNVTISHTGGSGAPGGGDALSQLVGGLLQLMESMRAAKAPAEGSKPEA
ncbi:MAG: SPFH domain-containing protein [Planctomycetota bacterium]